MRLAVLLFFSVVAARALAHQLIQINNDGSRTTTSVRVVSVANGVVVVRPDVIFKADF
jgi:hypothetical protein